MRGFFLSSKVYCSGTSNNLGVLSMKPPGGGGGGGGYWVSMSLARPELDDLILLTIDYCVPCRPDAKPCYT